MKSSDLFKSPDTERKDRVPFGQRLTEALQSLGEKSPLAFLASKGSYFSMPTRPCPLHFGQVCMLNLLTWVEGAFGLARKGSSLRTFPVPLQTGHLASIAIHLTQTLIVGKKATL